MARSLRLLTPVCLALVAGCSNQTVLLQWEGPPVVRIGAGGTKVVVEGIEFWDNGEPPRPYRVLGIIEDERPGGRIPMSRLREDVAAKAREAGGDAVIAGSVRSEAVGAVGTGSAVPTGIGVTGVGVSGVARRNYAKYTVIKFVDVPNGASK